MHAHRDAALAIGRGTEQEFLAHVRDQDQAYRLVGHRRHRLDQRHAMPIRNAGIDRDDARFADDEPGVADPPRVLGGDFARHARHHVDPGAQLDRPQRLGMTFTRA